MSKGLPDRYRPLRRRTIARLIDRLALRVYFTADIVVVTGSETPKRGKRHWLRRIAVTLVVLLLVGAGLTVYLLQHQPLAYRNAQQVLAQTTPESRKALLNSLLARLTLLTNEAENVTIDPYQSMSGEQNLGRIDAYGMFQGRTLIRNIDAIIKPEEHVDRFVELKLSNEELIALVHEMFVDWTIQRGYIVPGGINDPAVIVKDGELLIAFGIQTEYWQQVFSGKLELSFSPNGMAAGQVQQLYAGSLPVSIMSIHDMLKIQMPKSEHDFAQKLGDWLSKLKHFEFRPVIELDKRRRARVVGMTVSENTVTFEMRVQDHTTYKHHNRLMEEGVLAVTDRFGPALSDGSAFADVPATTD